MRLSLLLQPQEVCYFTTIFNSGELEESVLWQSNDEEVAIVGLNGIVEAVSEGKAIISVKNLNGQLVDYVNVLVQKGDKI